MHKGEIAWLARVLVLDHAHLPQGQPVRHHQVVQRLLTATQQEVALLACSECTLVLSWIFLDAERIAMKFSSGANMPV